MRRAASIATASKPDITMEPYRGAINAGRPPMDAATLCRSRSTVTVVGALAALAAGTLAGCGDDDSTGDAASSAPASFAIEATAAGKKG